MKAIRRKDRPDRTVRCELNESFPLDDYPMEAIHAAVESGEIPKSLDVAVLLVPQLQKEVLETKMIKSPEDDEIEIPKIVKRGIILQCR